MSRSLADLHPVFRPIAEEWQRRCELAGWHILIYFTARSFAEQAALWAQGRESVNAVNALRRVVNFGPLGDREARRRVTNAKPGRSWHQYGLAIDYVPIRSDGKPDWIYSPGDPADVYDETARLAKALGCIWGGDFETFKDYGHIEYHPGVTIEQALALHERNEQVTFANDTATV